MAKDKREQATGKKGRSGYLNLPAHVINSDAYRGLDGWAVKMLVDIGAQFYGSNNGDLCAPWSILRHRGWRSKGTIDGALSSLLEAGLIEQTRQGGRNRCSLYALTWRPIDECGGKLDVKPTKAPSARYLNLEKMLT